MLFLLKHSDTDLVEMAIASMGPNVNLLTETESKATIFFLAPGAVDSKLPKPDGGWRPALIQPFHIEKVELRSVREEAKRWGLGREYLEDPVIRANRLRHGDNTPFNINMVFEPTGRFVTKHIPRIQIHVWEILQGRGTSRIQNVSHVTNVRLISTLKEEHEKMAKRTGECFLYLQ